MTAGDHNTLGAQLVELSSPATKPGQRLLPGCPGWKRLGSGQDRSLVDIGSDDVAQRKHCAPKKFQAGFVQQARSRRRPDHRIEHHVRQPPRVQEAGNRGRNLRRSQHSDADGRNVKVIGERRQRLRNQFRRQRPDREHPLGRLNRQRRNAGHGVTSQGSRSLNIGGDSCARRGIVAPDAEDNRRISHACTLSESRPARP